jgi:hypothetical protein
MTDRDTTAAPLPPPLGISSTLLEEKINILKPTTTVIRQIPIISHGWEESAVEPTLQESVHENQLTAETLIPEHGWQEMHGFLGNKDWSPPRKISHCDSESRPGYASRQAHEYEDTPEVLSAKVSLLATLIRRSSNCLIYSGAGISTSSGINDYASQRGSAALENQERPKLRSPYEARPTLAHHGLVAMYQADLIRYWIQQNHDGLPQKAGLPQQALNEIHGAWYDPSNPVVAMSGNLRGDLFQAMLEWEERTDLTLAMGTTMCGMNSDRVFVTVAQRGKKAHQKHQSRTGGAIGGVIINLQQTQHDSISCLRIFSKLDQLMEMLVQELHLPPLLPIDQYSIYTPYLSGVISADSDDVFEVCYDHQGSLLDEAETPEAPGTEPNKKSIFQKFSQKFLSSKSEQRATEATRTTTLDLRVGSRVRLVSGPHQGDEGEVLGKNREGHYRIQFMHRIGKAGNRKPFETVMGSWWVEAAVRGTVPTIPVVNCV